eukprot:jgi/Ulvmu1/418/UM001_0425.1
MTQLLLCQTASFRALLSNLERLPPAAVHSLQLQHVARIDISTSTEALLSSNAKVKVVGAAPMSKRLRMATDTDVHSTAAEPSNLQSPDVSRFDAAVALQQHAAALACSCGLVQAIPAQAASGAGLWAAWDQLKRPQLSTSKATHELLASAFVACCGATIAIIRLALEEQQPHVPALVQLYSACRAALGQMRTLLPSLKCATATAAAAMCAAALALQLLRACHSLLPSSASAALSSLVDAPRAPEIAAAHAAAVHDGGLTRCMMLASHASAAVAAVESREQAAGGGSQVPDVLLQIIEGELGDITAGGDAAHASEAVLLITALSGCAMRPCWLALPLVMVQRLIHAEHDATSAGSSPAGAVAALAPSCVQLIAQDPPEGAASSLAKSVAGKVLEVQAAWAQGAGTHPAECMRRAVAAVALGFRSSQPSGHMRPAAGLRLALRPPAALTDASWAPLLLASASLELRSAAGAAAQPQHDGLQAALVEEVQHACRACSADGLWGCIGAALAAWWLLGAEARPQVLTALVARTQAAGQRGAACLSDALRAMEHMLGATVSEFLATQDALLLHIGTCLADHPHLVQHVADAALVETEWLAARVAEASLGPICQQCDRRSLDAVTAALGSTPARAVKRYLPLVVSFCLWECRGNLDALRQLQAGTLTLLADVLGAGGEPPLEQILATQAVMHCTKLELIYVAASRLEWGSGGQPHEDGVHFCTTLLQFLQGLQPEAAAEAGDGGAVRSLLTVETIEYFLQLLGTALTTQSQRMVSRGGLPDVAAAGGGGAAVLDAGAEGGGGGGGTQGTEGHQGLVVLRSLEQKPLQTVRTVLLLQALLGGSGAVHTLQFIAVLSLCMHDVFVGPVRVAAVHGMQQLVGMLATHAPDMLQQVASQIMGHVLAVLGEQHGSVAASQTGAATLGGGAGAGMEAQLQEARAAELEAAAALLQDLVVKHGKVLGVDVLAGLPPIPDDVDAPSLRAVRAALIKVQANWDFEDVVEHLTHSLQHQAKPIRHAALGNLHRKLAANPEDTKQVLLSVEPNTTPPCRVCAEPPLTLPAKLLGVLLACCDLAKVPDTRVVVGSMYLRLARCLGQLGAVHPSRIRLQQPGPPPVLEEPAALMASALAHILRILRTALHLDLVELCIFVLHKLLHHDVSREDGGSSVLRRLSAKDRTLAELHMRSVDLSLRYIPVSPAATGCVISSEPNQSFRRWLYRWIRQTLERCPKGDIRSILEAVSPAQSYDIQLMLFVLPYVLLGAITAPSAEGRSRRSAPAAAPEGPIVPDGQAAQTAILEEVAAVATLCCGGAGLEAAAPPTAQPREALHLQAILGALDTLKRWLQETVDACAAGQVDRKRKAATEQRVARLEKFLEALHSPVEAAGPAVLQLLAVASFRCGAAARALMLYELWLRRKYKLRNRARGQAAQPFERNQVTFIMHVYKSLNNPDALVGLSTLRQGASRQATPDWQITNHDWILAAQKVGRWSEVEVLYEVRMHAAVEDTQGAAARAAGTLGGAAPGARQLQLLGAEREDFLRSLLLAGRPQLLMAVADSWVAGAEQRAHACQAAAAGIAAAWRCGEWTVLDRFLRVIDVPEPGLSDEERWEVAVGRSLLLCQTGHPAEAASVIDNERIHLTVQMGPAGLESYERAHPLMIKLHMLYDLQHVGADALSSAASKGKVRTQLQGALGRAHDTGVGTEAQAEMLALLRALARIHGHRDLVAAAWLRQARACRASQHEQAAWAAVLEAEAAGCPQAFRVKAKLLWDAARHTEAIGVMRSGVEARRARVGVGAPPGLRKAVARGELKLLSWQVSRGQGDAAELQSAFEDTLAANPRDDKMHIEYAAFLHKVYEDLRARQHVRAGLVSSGSGGGASAANTPPGTPAAKALPGSQATYLEYVKPIIEAYSEAVALGSKRVLHALPRLLTALLEFGSDAVLVKQAVKKSPRPPMLDTLSNAMRKQTDRIVATFRSCRQRLPGPKLLPALQQAVSNIAHPHAEAKAEIHALVTSITAAFPHHALWMLFAVANSENALRKQAATVVLGCVEGQARKQGDDATLQLMASHKSLCKAIMELADWNPTRRKLTPISGGATFSLRDISRALEAIKGTPVMVPTQRAFEAGLTAICRGDGGDGQDDGLDDGQDGLVTIAGTEREVMLMQSKSMPKRIHFTGSDGERYRFLAKPDDDLRRDMRVMEFASLLNRLLEGDTNTRRRDMQVQTFLCLPLGDKGGLVEWVMNTQPFISIVRETGKRLRRDAMKVMSTADRQKWQPLWERFRSAGSNREERATAHRSLLDFFKSKLRAIEPVMHVWWLTRMPDPGTWLQARTKFMHTTAAWSIAGHIVGLGDRHCENLLIDYKSGANVQIDFGHLFDSGYLLPCPEIVPFRLTQNIVDSFGISGVEGGFRITCEAVMQVLRSNQQAIVGLLQAIVSDPFIDWVNVDSSSKLGRPKLKAQQSEEGKSKALAAMATVQGRLQGVLAGAQSQPCRHMTVPAHVDFLLNEAQDIELLCRMWWGWLPAI